MIVDVATARDRLAVAQYELRRRLPEWQHHEDYLRGKCALPFAPPGMSQEYEALRQQSNAPWLGLAMKAPVQRLDLGSVRRRGSTEPEAALRDKVWVDNHLASRQNEVYLSAMTHGEGIVGVWPLQGGGVRVAVESSRRVYREPDPSDPWRDAWQAKVWKESGPLPSWRDGERAVKLVGVVHDADGSFVRFEQTDSPWGGLISGDRWVAVEEDRNPSGVLPWVPFLGDVDDEGKPWSRIAPLIPAQDAINTVRFQVLLALNYSAFRQRIITNWDPYIRDIDTGEVQVERNADGTPVIDPRTGHQIPLVRNMGRAAVDKMLAVDGDSKVYDLPESNLGNYIEVLRELTTDLFARAQVPPQYLLARMANLSGDALAGAESTLASLVRDLQVSFGEAWEEVHRRAAMALGMGDVRVVCDWAEVEARSFAQVVDGIVKLIGAGFPKRAAWEMLPGANDPKVDRWVELADEEAKAAAERDPLTLALAQNPDPGVPGAADPAPSGA